jgi:Tol biopolymer transport system component
MNKVFFVCIAALLVTALQTTGAQHGPAQIEKQLARAHHKATVDGDLRGAIEEYKRIVAEAGANRAVAAQALLRMAECYQKLGDVESQRIYERIVREYADQSNAVSVARARLTPQGLRPPLQPTGTGMDAIQLWEGSDIEGDATLSPDGRYLVFSSWTENGNLLIKDLVTGVVRPLTRDAAVRTGGAQPWSPVFSPDGTQIAYAWFSAKEHSLRIIGRDGSHLRVLTSMGEVDFPYAWSPDGRLIAVNLYSAGQSRIALVSVAGGSITPLKSTAWRKADVGGFSADGKFLVYALPAGGDVSDSGVFTLAVDGSSEVRLGDGTDPSWTPDGRAVVFISDRSESRDLWRVPITDGKPSGAPQILRRNIQINHGFTRDGSLLYGIRSNGRDVFVASVAPASGRVDEPALLTEASVGSNGGVSWSPDGRHVAFVRGTNRFAMKLIIRNVTTRNERTVATTFDDGLMAQTQGTRWFPDGNSLLVRDRVSGRVAFKRIDVQTGSTQVIFDTPNGGSLAVFDLSFDGRFLFYVERGDDIAGKRLYRVIKRNVDSSVELELHRAESAELPPFRGLTVSPDGKYVAVRESNDRLLLLPVGGGSPIERQKGADAIEPRAWTHDGRYILGVRSENERDRLWAIPASGGAAISLGITAENINTVSVSRLDGALAFSVTRVHHELWLVRNLLRLSVAR